MIIRYIESESRSVKGKENEIYMKYDKEWHIEEKGKGNGNWLLTKSSDIMVDDVSYKEFVLDYYNRARLTRKLAERFIQDVESGIIQLGR